MLNPNANALTGKRSPLVQWIVRSIGIAGVQIRARLRGNDLHILCEGTPCPEAAIAVTGLVYALKETPLETFIPADQPQIYQIFLYGRKLKGKQPAWMERIYLNQLDRYLELLPDPDPLSGESQLTESISANSNLTDSNLTDSNSAAVPQLQQPDLSQPANSPQQPGTLQQPDLLQQSAPQGAAGEREPTQPQHLPQQAAGLEDCLLTTSLRSRQPEASQAKASDPTVSTPLDLLALDSAATELPETHLSAMDLSALDPITAELSESDLAIADLADLVELAETGRADPEADLTEADLAEADLTELDLAEPDLSVAERLVADSPVAAPVAAELSESDLAIADLADLVELAETERADFEADLTELDLTELDLAEADLAEADLAEADLADLDLSVTDLATTECSEPTLTEVDLTVTEVAEPRSSTTDLSDAERATASPKPERSETNSLPMALSAEDATTALTQDTETIAPSEIDLFESGQPDSESASSEIGQPDSESAKPDKALSDKALSETEPSELDLRLLEATPPAVESPAVASATDSPERATDLSAIDRSVTKQSMPAQSMPAQSVLDPAIPEQLATEQAANELLALELSTIDLEIPEQSALHDALLDEPVLDEPVLDESAAARSETVDRAETMARSDANLSREDLSREEDLSLEEHSEEKGAEEEQTKSIPRIPVTSSAMIVSNRSLAEQGQPDAIARYLSETLSTLGVGVNVVAKAIDYDSGVPNAAPQEDDAETQTTTKAVPTVEAETRLESEAERLQSKRRLWVCCQSPYSPDPLLVAEPVAERLRELKLSGFRDAVILNQVSGEATTDWALRVDLTPPDEMLREWARWGDVESIVRLLNQALAEATIQVSATLKEKTLHCFCVSTGSDSSAKGSASKAGSTAGTTQQAAPLVPDRQGAIAIVAPLLETLAPQGICSATVFGQRPDQETPVWVEWLDLPAKEHPALAETTMELAQAGDRPAIAFLLNRLLNPDLDLKLAIGGVRIQLRQKHDLLHIMADAPRCPKQNQVGPEVAKFLRQLRLPRIAGVRIYGRRAGQSRPLWHYGIDFIPRNRLVPEATPEFAASEAYVGDLISQAGGQLALRSDDLTIDDRKTTLTQIFREGLHACQGLLLRSNLFVPSDLSTTQASSQGMKVALIWGAAGLLLTLQIDWVMGQIVPRLTPSPSPASTTAPAIDSANTGSTASEVASDPNLLSPSQSLGIPESDALPNLSLKKSKTDDANAFNSSGFTHPGNDSITFRNNSPLSDEQNPTSTNPASAKGSQAVKSLIATPLQPSAAVGLALARFPYPTFNSRLLDEKFALYRQRITEFGPPDVLIVGSSRALRGIDPTALQTALAAQGYRQLDIFNFGLNGATAQVVDLLVRQFLHPTELPKIILWADGARAFNSGRLDITYNGVVASAGYKQLAQEIVSRQVTRSDPDAAAADPSAPVVPAAATAIGNSLVKHYQAADDWLNQRLMAFSASYTYRERLKTALQQKWAATFPDPKYLTAVPDRDIAAGAEDSIGTNLRSIDFDGFLALSTQFNPATYYQTHARVPGAYDADYQSFRIEGKQAQALKSLLQFVKAQEIPLVFVNLPLTQDYLDPTRAEREAEFQHFMLEAAIQNKFLFRNFSQLWPTQHSYFSDPSHLNRYGAYAVTQELAQDPMITWPEAD